MQGGETVSVGRTFEPHAQHTRNAFPARMEGNATSVFSARLEKAFSQTGTREDSPPEGSNALPARSGHKKKEGTEVPSSESAENTGYFA